MVGTKLREAMTEMRQLIDDEDLKPIQQRHTTWTDLKILLVDTDKMSRKTFDRALTRLGRNHGLTLIRDELDNRLYTFNQPVLPTPATLTTKIVDTLFWEPSFNSKWQKLSYDSLMYALIFSTTLIIFFQFIYPLL